MIASFPSPDGPRRPADGPTGYGTPGRSPRRSRTLFAAGLVLLAACSDDPPPTEPSGIDGGAQSFARTAPLQGRQSPRTTYNGRELFRGLLLSDGPVAALLPVDLVQRHDRDATYGREVREVLATIDRADPRFFAAFGRQINSGDRHKISVALEQGATRLFDALKLSEKLSAEDVEAQRKLGFLQPGAGLILYVPIWAWIWVYEWTWFFVDITDPSTTPLEREKVVDQIAVSLGM